MKTKLQPLRPFAESVGDDAAIVYNILLYAQRLSARALVTNTFGNIAIRKRPKSGRNDVIYTKHRGISLEEMGEQHIVAIDLETNELLLGSIRPSIGYQMHREIFRCRPDVHATIHLHPDDVIAYFSVMHGNEMCYVSNDTALVMGNPPCILPQSLNLELDISPLAGFIQNTNCIVMPNHGITTMGRNLSEAYHRAVSFSAEISRIIKSLLVSKSTGLPVSYTAPEEIEHMYRIGEEAIYGKTI
ncbi:MULTISPECIES: class II aldolase/adducin family protein [unclassified Undibacterium]|uniref:class II aldolase/adducin family protein n=1 Tax=unclassified Undibacterium TaxID=2630295 RepID=UPI002AC9EC74|nr:MULTISPECIES: class II aldolase/adducin family protein [unclassified Undibacterium]MEB0140487.1 class II aldolase/adducin family protein [Undibacterium sp. CCC2.1]MEB0173730.1 class II aldolase/adducin family protein [Undibacterium sp. CCC1.1]MEB0177730.1 class II aldolase/adducin family protein [Undibacterium sp. CCC3.4]MEB0217432.1 class II aldolase/adducin family protein [Undibacterium sp. 5I2]WPX44617.1 class II aldolase/adducin family protein [Undibacterium sp. CCC3.4]